MLADEYFTPTLFSPMLSSDALTVITMWLFNNHSDDFSPIIHPFQAMELFLRIFSELDWTTVIIGTHDIIDANNQVSVIGKCSSPFTEETLNLVMKYRVRYEESIVASRRSRDEVGESAGLRASGAFPDAPSGVKQLIKDQALKNSASKDNEKSVAANVIILNPIEPYSNLCSKVENRFLQISPILMISVSLAAIALRADDSQTGRDVANGSEERI